MKDLERFFKSLGGSLIWVFMVLIVGMLILRWVRSQNWGVVSTVAADTQNLATTGTP